MIALLRFSMGSKNMVINEKKKILISNITRVVNEVSPKRTPNALKNRSLVAIIGKNLFKTVKSG